MSKTLTTFTLLLMAITHFFPAEARTRHARDSGMECSTGWKAYNERGWYYCPFQRKALIPVANGNYHLIRDQQKDQYCNRWNFVNGLITCGDD